MTAIDGIRLPDWGHPDFLSSIEDRVDSAISSANSILNVLLAPVRGFVRAVLHPIFNFADLTIGWVYGVGHWAFDRLRDLAFDVQGAVSNAVGNAARWARDAYTAAEGFTRVAVGDLRHVVDDLAAEVARISTRAVAGVEQLIRAAVKEATDFARSWGETVYREAVKITLRVETELRAVIAQGAAIARAGIDDAVRLARAAAGEVQAFAAAGLDRLEKIARAVFDDAVRAAHALVDLVVRDVLAPLAGKVESFLATEWRWAVGLLHVIEEVADWLLWLDHWVVDEAIGTYKALKDFDPFDLDQVAALMGGAIRVGGV